MVQTQARVFFTPKAVSSVPKPRASREDRKLDQWVVEGRRVGELTRVGKRKERRKDLVFSVVDSAMMFGVRALAHRLQVGSSTQMRYHPQTPSMTLIGERHCHPWSKDVDDNHAEPRASSVIPHGRHLPSELLQRNSSIVVATTTSTPFWVFRDRDSACNPQLRALGSQPDQPFHPVPRLPPRSPHLLRQCAQMQT
jgi:hypothetical protein